MEDFETSQERPRKKKFWKFWIVMALINLGFLAIVVRLFTIQIIESDRYKEKARRMHQSRISLKAMRGEIADRNGEVLASNIMSYSAAVDPAYFKSKDPKIKKQNEKLKYTICTELSNKLGISVNYFLKKINNSDRRFVWLARGLTAEQTKRLRNISATGLLIIKEPKRHYRYGSIAAQLIGYTDVDNRGIKGVEKAWDSLLRGTTGYMIVRRDALGYLKPSASLPLTPPKDGNNIQLTIDIDIQKIVEYELRQGVEKYEAESGIVMAMDPQTGEILAMTSYPGFNPNTYAKNPEGIMKNRGISDTYEPGSTFKIVTAAAALEEGLTDTAKVYNAHKGLLERPGFTIRDDHPMERVAFKEALKHSSNIVFAKIAAEIPDHDFYKYMRDFGFGLTLNIDLPDEVKGKIPKPKDYLPFSKYFMGHGYSISVTPLQMLNAYASVANGGNLMKPYVVKKVISPKGKIIDKTRSLKIRRVISQKTAKTLTNLFKAVVDDGTGVNAEVEGIEIAGKTGTSQQLVNQQYSKQFYTASFVGYFPADNPRIAMIIILNRPSESYYGGSTAAPVFKRIALKCMSIIPEYTIPDRKEKTVSNQDKDSVEVPLITGLTAEKAEKVLEIRDLALANGNKSHELIMSQLPVSGETVPKNSMVKAYYLKKIYDSTARKYVGHISKPDVKGLPLRRATTILHSAGYMVQIRGSGKVHSQFWQAKPGGDTLCIISCK